MSEGSESELTIFQQVRHRVLALTDDEATDAEYDALLAQLESVPSEERFRTWRQTSILLDVRFRRRPTRVLRQLQRLREQMNENGRSERWERFHGRVVGLLGDDTITPHGYAPRLAALDLPALWNRVADLGRRLDAEGLGWFVTSGTLLGLVRHGGVVPHDDDVDLCVLLDADDEAAAAAAWLRARTALADLLRPQELHRAAHVDAPDGPTIDLFPAWIADGRLFAWPWSYGAVPAEAVLPRQTRTVEQVELNLPHDPEILLEVNYGPGWREPDPLFTFDWDAARERFAVFVAAVEVELEVEG